jgi:hypothetical protein
MGHARLLGEYWQGAPPSKYREIATALESRGIRYAWADYWTAYHVTFLANERVVVATREYPRIWTYNLLVQSHAQEAVSLSTQPCFGGDALVEGVFLCK